MKIEVTETYVVKIPKHWKNKMQAILGTGNKELLHDQLSAMRSAGTVTVAKTRGFKRIADPGDDDAEPDNPGNGGGGNNGGGGGNPNNRRPDISPGGKNRPSE